VPAAAWTIFLMGGEAFALPVKRVAEVLAAQKIRRLPDAPPFLAGLIDLRGDVMPVLDLRKRFHIRPAADSRERVIVLKKKRERIGLIVDDVREVAPFDREELEPAPSIFRGIGAEYLAGIGRVEGRMVVVIDIRKVLSEKELAMMRRAVTEHGKGD